MSEQLPAGTIIGDRYRITRALGSGGFGTVYEAEHLFIKRVVAIKVLDRLAGHPHAEKLATRFLREAELAARIEHSHVVTIYDFGFTGEGQYPYLAMQLLEGYDLRRALDLEGGMDPTRALPLFVGALDGLAEAHRQDIVHKDLKPGNLILRHPGTARESLCLVDFGLACLLDRDVSRLTESGHLSGTPRYLSPEYIREQFASPALDVYQMGLILIEALTGEVVVQSEDLYVVLMAHCGGQLPVPVNLLESPLGPVIRRALALDPGLRYPHAAAFRDALAAIDPATVPRAGTQLRMLNASSDGLESVSGGTAPVFRRIGTDASPSPSVSPSPTVTSAPVIPLMQDVAESAAELAAGPSSDAPLAVPAPVVAGPPMGARSRGAPRAPDSMASLDVSVDTSGLDLGTRRSPMPWVALAVVLLIGIGVVTVGWILGGEDPATPPPQGAPLISPKGPPNDDVAPVVEADPDASGLAGEADAATPTEDSGAVVKEEPAADEPPEPDAAKPAIARPATRRRRTAEPTDASPPPAQNPTRRPPTLSIVE